MLKHYLQITVRNLFKYKIQSLISMAGLTIGLTFFAFAYHWLQFETTYDKFYPDSDHMYVLYGVDKQSGQKLKNLPGILAGQLQKDFPEIKETTRLYSKFGSRFKQNGELLGAWEEEFVDELFFDFFPPKVICGRKDKLLQTHEDLVITEQIARIYWGSADKALGQQVANAYRPVMHVVAVIADAPVNSIFQQQVYELDQLDRRMASRSPEDRQWKNFDNQIFVRLDHRADVAKLEKKICKYTTEHDFNDTFYLKLIPLTAVRHTLTSDLAFNITYIRTFAAAGLLLLFCVFFNFINLLFNRVLQRNREMKLRNALGAGRWQLVLQLLLELTLQMLIAFLLGLCLLEVCSPAFQRIFETQIDRSSLLAQYAVVSLGGWIFLAGISLLPILRFVRFDSLAATGGGIQAHRRNIFRKISIGIQLTICVFFLTSAYILSRQVAYMSHKDLGFDKEGLIQLKMEGSDRAGIARELASQSFVRAFIATSVFSYSHQPNTETEVEWEGADPNERLQFQIIETGFNFPEGFGVPLKAGRFIERRDVVTLTLTSTSTVVVNEEAVRQMGLNDPVGKKMRIFTGVTYMDGGEREMQEVEIVGVIADFHASSLRNPIMPLIIRGCSGEWTGMYNYVRVAPGTEQEAIRKIRQIVRKHQSPGERETRIMTVSEIFDELCRSENASLRLFSLLGVLCILISIFGIYSISSSNIEQRKKEVAVRKVLGASVREIVSMFLREYSLLVLAANLVAFPFSYFFLSNWLQQYPYRIHMSAFFYLLVFVVTCLLVILTVLYQVIRAANQNPAVVVKSE